VRPNGMMQTFQKLTHAASFSRRRCLVAMPVVTTGTGLLSSTDDGASYWRTVDMLPITPVKYVELDSTQNM